ncbi:homeobox KN domain-containing protein [Trichoderma breve]|uniref:Homeobox KN domain-containing protein n=1 Tax=Trichoderma breve TaxID=2034170 RepID=A0A9W9JRI8_9HYPO|nr:homeobox KN domain-containing protein [Trichoderma breve]KAJ4864631.1 homeobox KN domain-containing protein [Trichoderma breve]
MTVIDELDEYVNWDNAGLGADSVYPPVPNMSSTGNPAEDDIGLVLENVNEDDFSFCALQHFEHNNFAQIPGVESLITESLLWETPDNPCAHCVLGGYSCKKIREGLHKGYCTSCVALGLECSFGGVVPDSLNPESTRLSWSSTDMPINTIPQEDLLNLQPVKAQGTPSFLDMMNPQTAGSVDDGVAGAKSGTPPKIGARFSRESVRILKNWLSTHNRHPYPSDEEKEMLQRQTGLNKTQITNWLANARRRGKAQPPRSTSPHVGNLSASIDIPRRRGTPALEAMNPLQRWEHSPPEHEPASVTAIARAVTASFNYTDDGSSRSLCNQSSASSVGTSHSSGGSLQSAFSHGRRRRRRRAAPGKEGGSTSLSIPLKTFQCTFCTETFRTKHDWQRHEKSLHLSLERWVNPDDAHVESHNHSACQERSLEERTFYRKDHLNQHLRLVHNVKFMEWAMKLWRVATPEIRSRCGFCGIVMDTWTIRVDHLAEHFKTGYSMADWKGDWGFEVPVLDMVENSIPPYLIHHERKSPLPYNAGSSPPESPRNAYELIKLELAYFGSNFWDQHGRAPSDEDMLLEGCRIIFASELLSLQGIATQVSWLRDIIMSHDSIVKTARFGPLRGAAENRLQSLKINGKDNLFEECPMERQLHEYVKAKTLLGLTTMDDELQEEARKIVGRIEEVCTHPSEAVANWLLRLITSSTRWLAAFRRRAHLPRSEDVQHQSIRSTDPNSIDSTIHNYSRLESELVAFLKEQRAIGREPTDEELQRKARITIYEFDDGWNQTVADNHEWLAAFRQRNAPDQSTLSGSSKGASPITSKLADKMSISLSTAAPNPFSEFQARLDENGNHLRSFQYFLNDANCYRRLEKELKRWVTSTMSKNNPNRHVPTDEELQYQARWILYDDDDPWNYTAADNAEWLHRFKRDIGIINDSGPGLPPGYAWALEQGGTGFAPPYAIRKDHEMVNNDVEVAMRTGAKPFTAGHSAVNSYLEELTSSPNQKPAVIFCSRELEWGLQQYAKAYFMDKGVLPSDTGLKAKGREILKATHTAADDPILLEKFKAWLHTKLPVLASGEPIQQEPEGVNNFPSAVPTNMDINLSDAELGDMLKDMDFDFGLGSMEGIEHDGGVSL